MAKKVVKKKITSKKPAVKKKAPIKAVKKTTKAIKPKIAKQAAVVASVVPQRAPERKIIDSKGGIVKVVSRDIATTKQPLVPEVKPAIEKIPEIVVQNKPAMQKTVQLKIAWNALPKYLPAQVRFLVTSSMRECERAANSPFPFAKFICSLPQSMCGLEFSFLILNLEHDVNTIARLTNLTAERAGQILDSASFNFSEKFCLDCLDMSRKLRTQLAGSGLDMDTLTEQYLISQVDRNFQTMLGAIILRSMGGKNMQYYPDVLAG